jgi:hypothetical protein
MALSVDVGTTTLQGTYVNLEGDPISGLVRFTPQSIIKDEDQNQIIVNSPITEVLDATGSFSVVLPLTDDTDVAPIPFAYLVEEEFFGGRTFYMTLPIGSANPSNIADLSEAVPSGTAALFVTQSEYNALLARYNAAQTNYDEIWDIDTNIVAAQTAATDTAEAASDAAKRSLSQLLLMGL